MYISNHSIAFIGMDFQNVEQQQSIAVFLSKEKNLKSLPEFDPYFLDYYNENLKGFTLHLESRKTFLM